MDRKKTKKNTSKSSPVDVRKRLEKLEKEKEELEERMKQLKADRDEERAKANLYTEIQRVSSTVNAMQQLMLESREELRSLKASSEKNAEQIATVKKATDDLQNNLGASVEKIFCDVDKVSGSVDMIKYEVKTIIIEREKEWKKERDELLEEVRRLQQEAGEHERLAAERHQTVSAAIEERAVDISSKIDRTEKRQTANHNEIIQRLTPVDKKTILILGGCGNIGGIDDMFILRKDRWIKLSLKLPKKNYEGGAVFLKEELYIFGGWGMDKETYKLDKQLKWKRLADMNEGRVRISNSCLKWKRHIWVFGGKDDKSVERYDPKEDKWTRMPDMKYSKESAAAAVWNDKFIVCGGWDSRGTDLKSVESFDPENGIWSKLNDMPSPYSGHSLVPYGNRLILMGEQSVLQLSDLEEGGKWRELQSMKYYHFYHTMDYGLAKRKTTADD